MGSFNDRLGAIAGGEGYPSLRERRAFVDALLAVRAGAGRGAEAQLAPLPLTVAIYDHAALPPPVLERAKRVATEIYGRIGVSLTWLAGPQAAAAVPTNTASSMARQIHAGLSVIWALRLPVARWRQCWSSASNTWRSARARTSAICWAS
jgi:hypothetical protein